MQECEVKILQNEMKKIQSGVGLEDDNEEFAKLVQENTKLKHRLAVLNRAIETEKKSSKPAAEITGMISIIEHLTQLFSSAIGSSYPNLENPPTVIAVSGKDIKFGDYQCNSALPICGLLKNSGIKESPRDIANKIVSNLESSALISKYEVAGAGFINIYLEK